MMEIIHPDAKDRWDVCWEVVVARSDTPFALQQFKGLYMKQKPSVQHRKMNFS